MNKTTKTLSLAVAMFAITGMTGAFSNQAFAGSTGEGTCSSGFWKNDDSKNDAENWPEDTTPEDSYEEIFGVDTTLRTKGGDDNNPSLRDALNAKGGKENALAREAAAALLNIRSGFDYPITEADLVAAMQNAFNGIGDDDAEQEALRAQLFDANHTESCPFENNEF